MNKQQALTKAIEITKEKARSGDSFPVDSFLETTYKTIVKLAEDSIK